MLRSIQTRSTLLSVVFVACTPPSVNVDTPGPDTNGDSGDEDSQDDEAGTPADPNATPSNGGTSSTPTPSDDGSPGNDGSTSGTDPSDSPDSSGDDEGSTPTGDPDPSADPTQDPDVSDNVSASVGGGQAQILDLGFGQLSITEIQLPNGHRNAKEQYQVAHYIGRTDSEQHEDRIDVAMRSYAASCATDTNEPHLFVSVSLADDETVDSATHGSVYELRYDPQSRGFVPTGNATILQQCYESHGIAVSEDCSRVAVLCNTGYRAHENYEVSGDLIEEYGRGWMTMEDNIDKIERRIENDLGLMITTNHRKYIGFFTEHPTIEFADFLPGLRATFPDRGFDETTTFANIKGKDMAEVMNYIVGELSPTDHADLLTYVRERAYRYNEQIWLLEWDQQPLAEVPEAYVVNKMHGGTHLGTQELIYVADDSQGRSSYGFTASARVFDDNGGSHYSAGLTIVQRNDWSIDDDERGWYWACGDGHVVNIRGFYNPDRELYGAICTSDWNDWIGNSHGQLGTIAIKMETASTSTEGYVNHFVPSNASMISNGGGHTVVPVDENTNLSVIVAPKLIADDDMNRFVTDIVGVDPNRAGPYDRDCADYDSVNCFVSYLSHEYWEKDGQFPSIPRQGLPSGGELNSSSLTRIGIGRVSGDRGSISGEAFQWLASDDDCQLSDPQLVDLHNGRYLLGFARFQCISDGLGYDRMFSDRGSMRMLIPKDFHLMEIDRELNVVAGPVQIDNHGWGGLDEAVSLGPGKVAWTYLADPTQANYESGQRNDWEAMVYHSHAR